MSNSDKKTDEPKEAIDKLKQSIEAAANITSNYPSILQIGSLHFKDSYSSTDAKPFMRVVHDVRIKDCVHQVLHNHWKVKQPRIVVLIISNFGPLKDWTNAQQRKKFQKGLMKAADNTNMWIIVNGINSGISTLIGEAVRNEITQIKRSRNRDCGSKTSKMNFIGIADESTLRYGESIANYKQYEIQIPNYGTHEDKFELNANLTHYIVIKDDTMNRTGVNTFLTNLMTFLSRSEDIANTSLNNNNSEDKCSITGVQTPVVSLVIQGGYESSRLVLHQIKNCIPVIVLGGSGGLADLLAFVENEISERCFEVWDPEYIESYIKPELTLKIGIRFPYLRDNALLCNTFRNRILDCVRESRKDGQIYLTVINMHNSYSCNLQNLSEYLLLALFKSQLTQMSNQQRADLQSAKYEIIAKDPEIIDKDLYLCVDWNCPELAKREVINKDPSFGHNLDKKMFEEALVRTNRCEFVDLFLTHGFRLRTFVSAPRLRRMFKRIHSNDFFRTVCWEAILGLSPDIKQSPKFIDRELNWLMNSCTGLRDFFAESELDYYVIENYPRTPEEAERKALAIFVIWSLFHFRKKLVKVLWKHSDQPIHLALVIAMIYERLSRYVTEVELREELQNESKQFVTDAYNILDVCYRDSADRAEQVLNETSQDWNYRSPVDTAAYARFRSFLSHPCCQKWLTNTFNGNIRVRELPFGLIEVPVLIKILTSAFLLFPMYFWIRFKDNKSYGVHSAEEEGIDDDEDNKSVSKIKSISDLKPSNKEKQGTNEMKDQLRKIRYLHSRLSISDHQIIIRKQPPVWKMIYELWNAPITKFWVSQLLYILYLSLFSLAVLSPKCGNLYLDYIVCVWTSLITADLIRRTYTYHIKFSNLPITYKLLEIVFQCIFITIYASQRLTYRIFIFIKPYTLKVILCINLLYAYYVLFSVYLPISATLGPLLYRLKLMVLVDFLNFMRLSVIAILSFGVVIQALLYPDHELSPEIYRKTFHRAFFSLFTTPLDEIVESANCKRFRLRDDVVYDNLTECSSSRYSNEECARVGFWPYIAEIAYFVLLKLILSSLLYAIFANSAARLSDTDNIWKFQRYTLVMEFVNRSPLPPPLNIFCYVYFAIRWIFHLLTCCVANKRKSPGFASDLLFHDYSSSKSQTKLLSEDDYSYFKTIASDYYEEQQNKINSEAMIKLEWERLQANCEQIEYEKKILKQLKGKLSETERAVHQSLVYLESIKHLTSRKYGMEHMIKSSKLHVISRHSPYPLTNVQRYPVPDKYVSWDVMFITYDPVAYTKPKSEFPISLQQFADEDILLLQETQIEQIKQNLPVFEWNRSSTNAAGITINRESWQVDENETRIVYKLDNGIPRNPFGRTGLRGRGSLLRWGPNHYVTLVITRMHSSNALQVLVEIDKNSVWSQSICLLTRFIPGECTYTGFESLFTTENDQKNWITSDKMIGFLKSCDVIDEIPLETETGTTILQSGLKYERLMRGYLDSSHNTDHAWKEVELWHFHYTQKDILKDKMRDNLEWCEVTENLFAKLDLSQSTIMQDMVEKLKAQLSL